MKILITGGAGCLGSNLLEHWLPQGHEILVLDNFATGKREVVPEVQGLKLIEGSVADAELVKKCMSSFQPEVVVHSAAAYKDPENWIEDTETNVIGSIHVAKAARAHGVSRLINFQTALCYGRPKKTPIPVEHPTAPFTSYGISKTAGEQFILMSGVPSISLRIANVTGPRLAIGPIPTFYKRLKASQPCFCSDTYRDFLDMSDFLSFMDLALNPKGPLGVFNISSGEGHSIKEIFDITTDFLGLPRQEVKTVPPNSDDVPVVVLDPAQTEKQFGWRAKASFEETIKRQLNWYEKHGVNDVFSHLKAPEKY